MAAVGVSSIKSESSRTFTESLSSAFVEWVLLFLLLAHAIFSYLATKFARYCGLQTPCLLCSRLHRIIGDEELGFYWDMICRDHKSEISSLVLCHGHCKLVDVHGICDDCLFSFATMNKSNAEAYRLLMGKLGADLDSGSSEDGKEFLSVGTGIRKPSMKLCSCCNKPWIFKGPKQTLLRTASIISQLDAPLSAVVNARKNIGDGSSKRRNHGISDLSHVGYAERLREKSMTGPFKVDPWINLSSSDTVVKLEEQTSSASLVETKVDATKTQRAGESKVDATMDGHDLVEIDGQKSKIVDIDVSPSVVELTTFGDFPSAANNGVTMEKLSSEACEHKPPSPSPPSKPSGNDTTVREANEALEKYSEEILEVEAEPITMTEKPVEANVISSHPCLRVSDMPDHGDGTRGKNLSGVLTDQRLSKDSSSKVIKDLKNLSSLLATSRGIDQISAPDTSPKNLPKDDDSSKTQDARHKKILPERNDSDPSEPPDSEANEAVVKDSEDTSKVKTEIIGMPEDPAEGNPPSTDSSPWVPNILDRGEVYKLALGNRGRQLSDVLTEQWLSKDTSSGVSKDLKNLFSQLSAPRGNDQTQAPDLSPKISLNQQGSMKTLEALQKRSLQRNESSLSQDGSLVGEIEGEITFDQLKRQFDHDRRALSTLYKELEEERNASAIATNEAMAMITRLQEEKAMLQMEALQYLRMMEEQAEYDMEALQKSNDLLSEREKEIQDLEEELEFYRINYGDENQISENPNIHLKSEPVSAVGFKDSTIGFEDERLHIHESLRRLEKKLGIASGEGVISEMHNSESRCSDEEVAGKYDSTQNVVSPSRNVSLGSSQEGDCAGEISPILDLTSVKNEVSCLQKRLGALEADRNFLEKTVRHLSVEGEGLQFVRDIATRLQEIRDTVSKAN
ncbi:hypothetical protein SAY87_008506 [Trapa incisa]|uniref:GTD-binding domain-containing protein n=1 Tax=Trapa incisa TaxID=236973 RepID=A0AAN7JVX3_9MYRT|nr:hypothetical protein SAY87_008506 [Trapa incisa]